MDPDDVDAAPKWYGPLPTSHPKMNADLTQVSPTLWTANHPTSKDFTVWCSMAAEFEPQHGWVRDGPWLRHPLLGMCCIPPEINMPTASGSLCLSGARGWLPHYTAEVLYEAVMLAQPTECVTLPPKLDEIPYNQARYYRASLSFLQKTGTTRRTHAESVFMRKTAEFVFMAVFDGHGKPTLAQRCAQTAFDYYVHEGDAEQRLRYVFYRLQAEYGDTSDSASGCIAVYEAASRRLYLAWVGTCFAALADEEGEVHLLSRPHAADDAREVARVMLHGGYVTPPDPVPRMAGRNLRTRALGDVDFRRQYPSESASLLSTPDYTAYDLLDEPALLVVATDGYVAQSFQLRRPVQDAHEMDAGMAGQGLINDADDRSMVALSL